MKNDFTDVADRVRATYDAVATTTVVVTGSEVPNTSSARPRRRIAVPAIAALGLVIVAAAIALLPRDQSGAPSTLLTSVPTSASAVDVSSAPTTIESATAPAANYTCGSELPRPLDVPTDFRGPLTRVTSVPGQLALVWTSATSRIEARWPADPTARTGLRGGSAAPSPDGKPRLLGGTSTPTGRASDGGYYVRTVYSFLDVPTECMYVQIDVLDPEAASVDAVVATMTDGGRKPLFVAPIVPLVIAREERATTPPVTPCMGAIGAVPPNRHGTASAGRVHQTAPNALLAFLETQPTLFDRGFLEILLPDRSIAYVREDTNRRDLFLYVIHVAPVRGGWFVDRWEITGC